MRYRRTLMELACLVAGGSRLLCLDEPTAGVAQREAEALVPLLHGRSNAGADL